MVAETLAALATAGATTLVGAMATDAWQTAKTGIARLFGRSGPEQQAAIKAQLGRNATQVEQAEDADRARQRLAASWELELESLLAEDPDAAEELKVLIAQVHAKLPPAQQTWVQTNIARDHGTVFAVQGGNLVIHRTSPQEPDGPAAGDKGADR